MTPEDREIWGRVSSAFAASAPPRALTFAPLSYIGLAIGLPHMSGAQDTRDYYAMREGRRECDWRCPSCKAPAFEAATIIDRRFIASHVSTSDLVWLHCKCGNTWARRLT
jgi:hypothetical protein